MTKKKVSVSKIRRQLRKKFVTADESKLRPLGEINIPSVSSARPVQLANPKSFKKRLALYSKIDNEPTVKESGLMKVTRQTKPLKHDFKPNHVTHSPNLPARPKRYSGVKECIQDI